MGLTVEQQDFLAAEGRIVLCAVPGSGKTFIVAKKIIKYLEDWRFPHRGVAALSFTNVASDEIRNQVSDTTYAYSDIGYPHFVGTLDSFINNFILLRFGYLMQKENRTRPIIVHENFSKLTFQSKYAVCHKQMCTQHPEWFHWSTTKLLKEGKIIVKDIDVNGTQHLIELLKQDTKVVTIFLRVPKDELQKRLESRIDKPSPKEIQLRLNRFDFEESKIGIYDYVIKNNDLEKTVSIIQKIIEEE